MLVARNGPVLMEMAAPPSPDPDLTAHLARCHTPQSAHTVAGTPCARSCMAWSGVIGPSWSLSGTTRNRGARSRSTAGGTVPSRHSEHIPALAFGHALRCDSSASLSSVPSIERHVDRCAPEHRPRDREPLRVVISTGLPSIGRTGRAILRIPVVGLADSTQSCSGGRFAQRSGYASLVEHTR
jgi:hypothetical protein